MVVLAVTCFAWLIFFGHIYILIDALVGLYRMRQLSAVVSILGEQSPKVSIISV